MLTPLVACGISDHADMIEIIASIRMFASPLYPGTLSKGVTTMTNVEALQLLETDQAEIGFGECVSSYSGCPSGYSIVQTNVSE